MPFVFSERLPLPHLRTYCLFSFALFATSLIYGKTAIETPVEYVKDVSGILLSEPFCLWSLVNMAFCCLFLLGRLFQQIVLGDLRLSEEQHLQDKFWNFVFYKIIFVFGVINAQSLHEVLCWSAWFSMLGFWHIIGQLCKDRYEYITSSPTTPLSKHIKLYSLILCVFLSSIGMSIFAIYFGYPYGINEFAFMIAECALLGLKSLHVLVKYTVQLGDFSKSGTWDKKAKFIYYVNLFIETMILTVDLVYHFHMLIWSNVFLSMASLVLYWNIRTIFSELKKKVKNHRKYKTIMKNVDRRFPFATQDELDTLEDHCAICWDSLETARRLPCGHFFHHACLCSWLLQDTSCPTCRNSLSTDVGIPLRRNNEEEEENSVEAENIDEIVENENNGTDLRNYFFYLDGQRIANWFPSFSIEVFHGRMGNNEQELNDMTQQLTGMFPNIAIEAIMEDLRQTRSVEATADNILDGRLPEITQQQEESPVLIENDEHPPVNATDATITPLEPLNTEQPSDYESTVEESSGAEDVLQNMQNNPRSFTHRRGNYAADVRRRLQKKSSNSRLPADNTVPEQPPQSLLQPARSNAAPIEREGRRNLILEAIERRQPSSIRQQPS